MNPYAIKAIVGVVIIALIFGAGWTIRGWKVSGKIERLESDLRIERANSEAWQGSLERCQSNRETLTTRLDALSNFFSQVAQEAARLEGSAWEARRRAAELDAARDQLVELHIEHREFLERTRNMTLCQTYEAVLVELAGGGP